MRQAGAQRFQKRFLGGPDPEQLSGSLLFLVRQGEDFRRVAERGFALQQIRSAGGRLKVDADRAVEGQGDDREIVTVGEVEMQEVIGRCERGFSIFGKDEWHVARGALDGCRRG